LIAGRIAHNRANSWHVSSRQSTPNGIRHQLFGHRADEGLGLAQQGCAKLDDTIDLCAVDQLSGGIHQRAARPAVFRTPGADGVEVLERQAGGIDHPVAARTSRVAAMLFHALAHRLRLCGPGVFFKRGHDVRRGRGRRPQHVFENPLPAQDGRRPMRV
jgi:hypothetical protein